MSVKKYVHVLVEAGLMPDYYKLSYTTFYTFQQKTQFII